MEFGGGSSLLSPLCIGVIQFKRSHILVTAPVFFVSLL